MYSDRKARANNVGPDQTPRLRRLIMAYTVCHSPSSFTYINWWENVLFEEKYKVKSKGCEYLRINTVSQFIQNFLW